MKNNILTKLLNCENNIQIEHEHIASTLVKNYLLKMSNGYQIDFYEDYYRLFTVEKFRNFYRVNYDNNGHKYPSYILLTADEVVHHISNKRYW